MTRPILVLWTLAAGALFAQSPAFEVASVKPAKPGETGGRMQFLPGGRFSPVNVPLNYILQQIYHVRDFQIAGDPQWKAVIADGYSSRYMIEAKGDASATQDQLREMVKTLLADRFKLKVHEETRELPVYALIPGKNGIKLRPSGSAPVARPGDMLSMDRGWIEGNRVSMDSLVSALSRSVDRPVIDKTGFTEPFDFRLTWTPDTGAPADSPGDGRCAPSFALGQEKLGMKPETWDCPSIFTAVQDQLGLKLDAQKARIEVLVIDRVERPSAD